MKKFEIVSLENNSVVATLLAGEKFWLNVVVVRKYQEK